MENSQGLFFQIPPSNLPKMTSINITPFALASMWYILQCRHKGRRKTSSPKLDNKIIKKFIKLKYGSKRI